MATYTISYNANGGTGTIQPQTKQSGVDLILSDGSGFSRQYYTLDGWADSASAPYYTYRLGGVWTQDRSYTLYAFWSPSTPSAPITVSAVRQSDTSVKLTWTPASGALVNCSVVQIERQVNDGSWSVVSNSIPNTASTYIDTGTKANNYYKYRIKAIGYNGKESTYNSFMTTVYMTPGAPTSISTAWASATSIVLTVDNANTRNATGFEVEVLPRDSSTWSAVTPSSSTGTPVTSITIANQSGGAVYRVRNTRSDLKSAWIETGVTPIVQAPYAPTLISPASGAIINGASSSVSVTLTWQHNPKDGTAQTEATIMVQAQGSSPSYYTATTAQEATISLPRNQSYAWSVRTKGVSSDWSDWSSTQIFAIYQPPTLNITQPSSTIAEMPIAYSVSYTDNYGVFVSGTILIKLNGNTVYSENLPSTATTIGTASPISGEITTNEFLPSSGNTYTFEVTAVSSDTLSSTTSVSRAVNMGEPNHGTLSIVNDQDTGYANMVVGWDDSTGAVSAVSASIYRVADGQRVLIGENLPDGTGITDKYAPLNTPYKYEVVTVAASNEVAAVEFDNTIETLRWFAYWGNKVAWAKWNPAGDYKIERPQKRRVHYAGRTYPVSYDGTAIEEEYSMNFTVVDYEDWSNGFNDLLREGGRGIYKSCDGKVFHADFELTNTPKYTSLVKIGEVSLKIIRIEGDVL